MRAALLVGVLALGPCAEPPPIVDIRPGCSAELMSITTYRRGVTMWSMTHDVVALCYRTASACGTKAEPSQDGHWYWNTYSDHAPVLLVFPCERVRREYSEAYPHGIDAPL